MYQRTQLRARYLSTAIAALAMAGSCEAASGAYRVFVTNERSGDVTVIDGSTFKPVATIAVGKRPRGIHASADGSRVYVALSGTPIEAPPQLDAHGNPIFKKGAADDDDDDAAADKTADGIGVLDASSLQLVKRLSVGSDPEEFALSKDESQLYVSNEDVKTASVVDIASNKVRGLIAVGQEPEGVATTPDGNSFWVTCEAGGDVYVVDAHRFQVTGHFTVDVRPRSVDFLPAGDIGFVPSESSGELNIIDVHQARVIKTISLPMGSRPMRVRVSKDGLKAYVSNGRAGTVSVLDTHTYSLLDTIKVGTRPWGIVLSPDGRYLFSANGPSNDVSVVDLNTDKEIARVPAGNSPWGLTVVTSSR